MEPTQKKDTGREAEEAEIKMAPPENIEKSMNKKVLIIGIAVLVAIGIFTGYILARAKKLETMSPAGSNKVVKTGKVVGSLNDKAFPDNAEGALEKGGIDGEGTHKLIREGGPSQNVYLTSSVINLDDYVGKKVKVWGETFAAQKAGWLMDVGRLEIL